MKSVKGDVWLAIVVIVGAAIYLYMDMRLPEVRLSDPLGPKAFPALVGVGLISSALLLLFERHSKTRHATDAERAAHPAAAATPAANADPRTALNANAATLNVAASSGIDASHSSPQTSAPPTQEQPKPSPLVLIGMVLWTIAYYFAFDRAGYLIATSVFLLGLLSYFNRKRIKMNVAIALGVTVVFDLLFSQLLGVPMPRGILPF
ncbi:tripartite tricarboxylate transporter TctB family protein [Paraburkholderia phosphatilytica]|uniref:tripartite tricarboxylate transporter TctB family protein n=1 Tax=Paraburkholderia phosphatilytica TaxID=2282883 RepID=UPI000E4CD42F|nr:tripartite tricarboxylate transporter TctB family protein [Paraburkholderia phosphatilytica]